MCNVGSVTILHVSDSATQTIRPGHPSTQIPHSPSQRPRSPRLPSLPEVPEPVVLHPTRPSRADRRGLQKQLAKIGATEQGCAVYDAEASGVAVLRRCLRSLTCSSVLSLSSPSCVSDTCIIIAITIIIHIVTVTIVHGHLNYHHHHHHHHRRQQQRHHALHTRHDHQHLHETRRISIVASSTMNDTSSNTTTLATLQESPATLATSDLKAWPVYRS